MNNRRVTLQINLAPTYLPHAQYILSQQFRQWADQVAEFFLIPVEWETYAMEDTRI